MWLSGKYKTFNVCPIKALLILVEPHTQKSKHWPICHLYYRQYFSYLPVHLPLLYISTVSLTVNK